MLEDQKQTLGIIIFILLIILGILLISFFIDRKNSKSPTKSNLAKYKDLINTLTILEQILDEKIKLGRKGIRADYGNWMPHQMVIIDLVSKGKLAIFGPAFTQDLMKMFEFAEFDLIEIENASRYVKNELVKLRKLV